ncbi:MAG: hypothetical protein U0800_19600 [Isosphaeraceae bacterium]
MTVFRAIVPVLAMTWAVGLGTMTARGQASPAPKKVALVELFTSHG